MNIVFMVIIALCAVMIGLGGGKRMSMICTFRKLYKQAKEDLRGKKDETESKRDDKGELGINQERTEPVLGGEEKEEV